MPGYILTGAPGSGKTSILRQLELDGHLIVEEAATDVIALCQALGRPRPWEEPGFIDDIITLQRNRQLAAETMAGAILTAETAPSGSGVVFFDRSPVCTLALSRYAELPLSRCLLEEVDRALGDGGYHRAVFFIRNQGSIETTAARRITFEDSLRFEKIHELTYQELGFELIEVPSAALPVRVALIRQAVAGP